VYDRGPGAGKAPGPAAPYYETMEITPPSARREAANVLRLAAVILLVTWVYLANTAAPGAGADGRTNLVSFQKLFRDLGPSDQRMFRSLQEGLLEAENLRASSGAWPTPATLALQGIPPFAVDPIAKQKYNWSLHHEGILVNYLGLPALGLPAIPNQPAYLILVQEPTPGALPDRAPNDEEHHRLANGDVLHVSVWMHGAGAKLPDALFGLPEADGWTQLLAGSSPPPAVP
jgi:hypothetical protein